MSFFSNLPKQVNGNICLVQILPLSHALAFDFSPGRLTGNVTPKPGFTFQDIITSARSVKLADNSEETPSGNIYRFELSAQLSGLSPTVESVLLKYNGALFYVKVNTGTDVLLFESMKLSYKPSHPGKLAAFSGYQVTFSGDTPNHPVFVV